MKRWKKSQRKLKSYIQIESWKIGKYVFSKNFERRENSRTDIPMYTVMRLYNISKNLEIEAENRFWNLLPPHLASNFFGHEQRKKQAKPCTYSLSDEYLWDDQLTNIIDLLQLLAPALSYVVSKGVCIIIDTGIFLIEYQRIHTIEILFSIELIQTLSMFHNHFELTVYTAK